MLKPIKTWFGKLPTMVQLVIGVALLSVTIWFAYSVYNYASYKIPTMIDNYKDQQLEQKDKQIEAMKIENQKKIDILLADNGKLKKENIDKDAEIKAINDALANDGKIIKSEQQKIDEAHKKYNETKNSCNTATDPDAYVQCVCAELGVACP